ncbi:hypothetical protein LXA43DRAFT_1036469 [Ganoderma leucocontextum]|nr:hypothetical protein LXA43DRAFT_1036469 [Ganoderma leucocontextum]
MLIESTSLAVIGRLLRRLKLNRTGSDVPRRLIPGPYIHGANRGASVCGLLFDPELAPSTVESLTLIGGMFADSYEVGRSTSTGNFTAGCLTKVTSKVGRSLPISTSHACAELPSCLEPMRSKSATSRIYSDISTFTAAGSGHSDIAFSPDGELVLTMSRDAGSEVSSGLAVMARVLDSSTGVILFSLKGHTDSVSQVRFSPCRKYIASASADRTVRLWRRSNGVPGWQDTVFWSGGWDSHYPTYAGHPFVT